MKPLLLVDGYNVIGAWNVPREEHLTIEQARERLVHLIADYAGYSGEEVIVVFDGHYTDRPTRSQHDDARRGGRLHQARRKRG